QTLKPVIAEKERALKAAAEREKSLTAQLDVQQNQMEEAVELKLQEQRRLLDEARAKDLAKKDSEHNREIEKMQMKLQELSRKLEKKTANELGESPEVDLFDALRESFPDDRIERVRRGAQGADIHQTVIHKGQRCGLIIFDS